LNWLSWRDCLKILGLRIVVDEDRGSYLASKGFLYLLKAVGGLRATALRMCQHLGFAMDTSTASLEILPYSTSRCGRGQHRWARPWPPNIHYTVQPQAEA
jgi:hypothetical protein